MMWFAVAMMAWAGAAEPLADVRRPLGDDAWVNWTTHRVEVVRGVGEPGIVTDSKPLEQQAIQEVTDALPQAVGRVPVTHERTAAALVGWDAARAARAWHVAESRYFSSGRVEVVGVVRLHETLAAWDTARSVSKPEATSEAFTGVVIDARGLDVVPSWAPIVRGPDALPLFEGVLWRHLAWETPPAVWVGDPAAPMASAAGAKPAFFVAAGWEEGAIVLSEADAQRFGNEVRTIAGLGAGAVVIVVDP